MGCELRSHTLSRFPKKKEIPPIERTQTRVNEQIRLSPIRVIAEDGEQLGVIPTEDALSRARENGLDLVEVAPNERPPVCRMSESRPPAD